MSFLGLVFTTKAQKFQGTISWSANYSFSNESSDHKASMNLPTKYIFKYKDGDYVINVEGTPRPIDMLWRNDKGQGFKIDPEKKAWSVILHEKADGFSVRSASIVNTGEKRNILGYECTKYVIHQADPKITLEQVYWVTLELGGLTIQKDLAHSSMGGTTTLFHKDINGMPLRIEINSPTKNILVQATSIKRELVSDSIFSIPANYKESK